MRSIPFLTAACAAATTSLAAQNLIPNAGFEAGVGPVCSSAPNGQQGLLPAPWLQAGFTGPTGGADTHTQACAVLPGLDGSWGNYAFHVAHCGARWAAAWNATATHEAIACRLARPLTPGRYLLAGFFLRATRTNHTLATGYDCHLSENPSITAPGTTMLAAPSLGAGAPVAWAEFQQLFTYNLALATAPYLVLDPAGTAGTNSSYMGVDDLVLVETGGFYEYPQRASTPPRLAGNGTVAPGASFSVELAGAPPVAPCVLLLGFDQLCVPLLGQLLVVNHVLAVPGVTTVAGTTSQTFTWPQGAQEGMRAFFQIWVATSPTTLVASNGLAAVGR